MSLRCGSLSITTLVSLLGNKSDVWSVLHGQKSLAAVNQILCNSWGYEQLQKSKDSLKDCFENVTKQSNSLLIITWYVVVAWLFINKTPFTYQPTTFGRGVITVPFSESNSTFAIFQALTPWTPWRKTSIFCKKERHKKHSLLPTLVSILSQINFWFIGIYRGHALLPYVPEPMCWHKRIES